MSSCDIRSILSAQIGLCRGILKHLDDVFYACNLLSITRTESRYRLVYKPTLHSTYIAYDKVLPGEYLRWSCISVNRFDFTALISVQLYLVFLYLCIDYSTGTTDNLIHNSGLILKVTDKNHGHAWSGMVEQGFTLTIERTTKKCHMKPFWGLPLTDRDLEQTWD